MRPKPNPFSLWFLLPHSPTDPSPFLFSPSLSLSPICPPSSQQTPPPPPTPTKPITHNYIRGREREKERAKRKKEKRVSQKIGFLVFYLFFICIIQLGLYLFRERERELLFFFKVRWGGQAPETNYSGRFRETNRVWAIPSKSSTSFELIQGGADSRMQIQGLCCSSS